jgi:hypothetical protein
MLTISSSVFAKRSISGRCILNQRGNGSFVFDMNDFEFAYLTHDDTEDVQMVWWLITAYFPLLNQVPRGTRFEIILAMRLLVSHLKDCAGAPPSIENTWSHHRKLCVDIAFQRLCAIIDVQSHAGSHHNPDAHEWDGAAALGYRHILVHLNAVMQKMTDESVLLKRKLESDQVTTTTDANEKGTEYTTTNNNTIHKKMPKNIISVFNQPVAADSTMPTDRKTNVSISNGSSSPNNNNNNTRLFLGAFRGDSKRWWSSSWPTGPNRWFFKRNTSTNRLLDADEITYNNNKNNHADTADRE